MNCEDNQFPAPFVETDNVLNDFGGIMAAWEDSDLIEDAITGIPVSGSASEDPSRGLQGQSMEAIIAPLESHLQELDDLSNWLLSDVESCKIGFLPSAQDPGNMLQTDVDFYGPEPDQIQNYVDPLDGHSAYSAPSLNIDCAHDGKPNEVWLERDQAFQCLQYPTEPRVAHEFERNQDEQEDSNSLPTCNICLAYIASDRVVTPCGHVFCQFCLSLWLQDEAQPCPQCSTLLSMDAGVITSYANPGSSVESRTGREFEDAPEPMNYQQGYQPGLASAQYCDTMQLGTQELNQAGQGLTMEYQPAHLEVWQLESGNQSDPFLGLWPTEAVAESGPSVDAAAAFESEQQFSRKRGREKTLVVDHNGVAMRFDGVEERFTAYYRPSYWTEDDSAVFLGEYPTFEEAKDAHNLVTLLHEGPHAQMDLTPFTADKYAEELKKWEGKHHVDLVCQLRLRGRGFVKDGSVNYKHVGRRKSTIKTGVACTRYFSTVLNDPGQPSQARTGKPKRAFLQTFGTPEEAARYADQISVKQRGLEAWTNFPLSSYIADDGSLPLTFLPLSNNFRENLAYKRARNF